MADKHPIRDDPEVHCKTYEQVCNKFRKFYGIEDVEQFYAAKRQHIIDKCEPDEFGWAKHESLRAWHEDRIMRVKYGMLDQLHDAAQTTA